MSERMTQERWIANINAIEKAFHDPWRPDASAAWDDIYAEARRAREAEARLVEGQEALRAQTVRIRRAICENDAQFNLAEDTEVYAKMLKARADKAEAEETAIRKNVSDLLKENTRLREALTEIELNESVGCDRPCAGVSSDDCPCCVARFALERGKP